jgi:hypothetical protein
MPISSLYYQCGIINSTKVIKFTGQPAISTVTLYIGVVMLENEQAFYIAHRAELRAKYFGKRVVIADDQILGIYDTDREALRETVKTRPRGSFMVKFIPVDPKKEIIRLSPIGNVVSYG